jgi:glycosyltransferase involved in cell wall biosynthesis
MSKPIKLLLSTDSPVIHTGLAETTRLVFNRLLQKFPGKYAIEQIGWYHYPEQGQQSPWPVHATAKKDGKFINEDKYGQRSFESILRDTKPDIVYTNGDLWCFQHMLDSPTRNTFRLLTYYTIDGQPYWGNAVDPGKKSDWGSSLSKSDKIVVLTEFGKETLENSCPEVKDHEIDVVYHPVDITRFKRLEGQEKLDMRQRLWAPAIPRDAFVVGWVGRNQFRKMNYLMWETMHYVIFGDYISCKDCGRVTRKEWDHCAFKSREVGRLRMYEADYDYTHCWHCKSDEVVEGTPRDDVYLWTHMNKQDPGWNCDANVTMWGLKDRVVYTNGLQAVRGIPPQQLADLMSTWDCMLYLSGGEGFGIPAYESMMAGVPVVYSNYSSHADFCQHGGVPIRCDFIPELSFTIQRAQADVNHAVEELVKLYSNPAILNDLGKKARTFTEDRPLDDIVDEWDRIFTEMMEKPVGVENTEKVYAQTI